MAGGGGDGGRCQVRMVVAGRGVAITIQDPI